MKNILKMKTKYVVENQSRLLLELKDVYKIDLNNIEFIDFIIRFVYSNIDTFNWGYKEYNKAKPFLKLLICFFLVNKFGGKLIIVEGELSVRLTQINITVHVGKKVKSITGGESIRLATWIERLAEQANDFLANGTAMQIGNNYLERIDCITFNNE